MRHNPEIRWRLRPADIADMAQKQMLILKNAATAVRSGGVLIYSTCSLETDENETLIADFIDAHPDFQIAPFDAPRHLITGHGMVRTWPHRDDVEGFFVAALRKKD